MKDQDNRMGVIVQDRQFCWGDRALKDERSSCLVLAVASRPQWRLLPSQLLPSLVAARFLDYTGSRTL